MIPYSQLHEGPRVNFAEAAPLSWPLTIYLEPTNVCNMECSFCPHGIEDYEARAGYSEHMPFDLYARLIGEIAAAGGVRALKLYFFGEPLLHPRIEDMLWLASRASERVEVTTNGTALTEKVAKAMIAAKTGYLRVSIYREYEKYSWLILRNVRRLREMRDDSGAERPAIFVKCFSPADVPDLTMRYEGVADEVGVERFHSIGSDCIPVEALTGKQKACAFPFYTLVIKANGDAVPCCVAWEKSLVVGNANQSTIRELWTSERMREIQRLHLSGKRCSLAACKDCDTLHNTSDSVDALSPAEFDRRLIVVRKIENSTWKAACAS